MMLAALLLLNTMELLQNGLQPHQRTVDSFYIDADAQCKWAKQTQRSYLVSFHAVLFAACWQDTRYFFPISLGYLQDRFSELVREVFALQGSKEQGWYRSRQPVALPQLTRSKTPLFSISSNLFLSEHWLSAPLMSTLKTTAQLQ